MEYFIVFDGGGLIIAAVVGIILIFYSVKFGIEDFVYNIHSNELKMFIIIAAIVAVIAVIAYFVLWDTFDKTSEKISTFLTFISASICVSYTLFYFINSLVTSILDAYNGLDLVFRVLLCSIPWMFLVLIVQLLILGIPSLIISWIYGEMGLSDNTLVACLGGLLNIAIASVCAYFAVHPALIGNFNIYELV